MLCCAHTTDLEQTTALMLKMGFTLDGKKNIPLVLTWPVFPPASVVWSVEPYLPFGFPPTSQPGTEPLPSVHPGGYGQWESGQLGAQDLSSEKTILHQNFDIYNFWILLLQWHQKMEKHWNKRLMLLRNSVTLHYVRTLCCLIRWTTSVPNSTHNSPHLGKMLGGLGVKRRGEFSAQGTRKKQLLSSHAPQAPLGLLLRVLNHPSPSSDFPLSVRGYPPPPLPAPVLWDHTYRLVLVLQTAGSHIRHGCRCSGNSGFHSSSPCEAPR